MSTSGCNNSSSPPYADNVPRLPPIHNTIVGSDMRRRLICQIRPVEGTRTWTTPNQPLSTPSDHLRAAHILIAFLAATAETEQRDDDNRSIGWNYCIRTTADGPYVAAGIFACNHIVVVNSCAHNSENNSNKYLFF
jgi:hypothetical protein